MRSAYKIVNMNTNMFFLALFSTILLLYACGGSGDSGGTAGDTGSISFSLKFDDISPASVFRAAASPSGDVCEDYQMIDIAADVYDSSYSVVASDSWPCSAHQGTIADVPAESDLSLICEGITVSGNVDWRGEIAGITILPGEVTEAGTVTMIYIGDDIIPPYVEPGSPSPESGETDVPIDDIITAKFNEKMVSASINENSFTLTTATTQISGTATYDPSELQASFIPDDSLDYLTTYTATITTDVQDLAGHPMAEEYTWSFSTITPPQVQSTSPESDETEVPIGVTITATFSEEMLADSINENSFILTTDTTQISGTVTYDPSMRQASFTPDDNLDYDTVYKATITTDVQDLAGNPMAAEYTWSFTTINLRRPKLAFLNQFF